MKKPIIITLGVIILAVLAFLIYLLIKGSGALNGPESITYDADAKRFLVSNTLGKNIVTMTPEGKFGKFINKGLNEPRGIIIWGKKLFVADHNRLIVIDPATAKILDTINIPEAKMLNDVAVDKTGLVYITDTEKDCVFLVNPKDKSIDKVISPLLKAPNGIVYDMPRDQMFIVGFSKRSPILSLSTKDRGTRIFMDSIYSDLDGIAIDDLGRIYISTWAQDMIFMIPQEQNRFIAQFKEIKDAADIYYHLPNNELVVPLFSQNKVIHIPVE